MEEMQIEHLSFTYPEKNTPAIFDLSLTIPRGSFTVLCGKSGCGKSTLLRLVKPALSPHGEKSGTIRIFGRDISTLSDREQAEKIGFVLQNPDNQIVCDKVWHELAFGLESLGYGKDEIRTRVSEMASFFGIEDWFFQEVSTLSGGQKQLLNLAAVMTMQPSILILDEPTSQLDPIAAESFFQILARINRELGTTILLSEHRLEEVFPLADQVIFLENAQLLANGSPREIAKKLWGHEIFCALPTPMRVFSAAGGDEACPVTVREGRNWLLEQRLSPLPPRTGKPCNSEVVLSLKDIWFRYARDSEEILRGFSLELHRGEFYALLGGNGTGKTTALSIAAGLSSPQHGKVQKRATVTMLTQNPQELFSKNRVSEELLSLANADECNKMITLCELEPLLDAHPYDLSGGEQQRLALAMALLKKPEILILDEPTKGLDACFKKKLAEILKSQKNLSILLVSHDLEFCAEYADRIGMIFAGQLTSEGTPEEFFAGKSFYTTAANRMARNILPQAILASDLIYATGGSEPVKADELPPPPPVQIKPEKTEKTKKSSAPAAFLPLLLVPVTVLFGIYFLGDRKYYWISLCILAETLFSFFLHFEKRKPSAHELVTVSVLCATAVFGRAAFAPIPQFKPAAAVVILSGIAFGGETGFFVGAATAFLSNFFFGQGPWTPWQMLAFGTVGLVSGIGFGKQVKSKLLLAVLGFSEVLILYGGIMNPASVLMSQPHPTSEMLLSAYALGIPADLVHAASTALFLWLAGKAVLEKLDRVKKKYNMNRSQI